MSDGGGGRFSNGKQVLLAVAFSIAGLSTGIIYQTWHMTGSYAPRDETAKHFDSDAKNFQELTERTLKLEARGERISALEAHVTLMRNDLLEVKDLLRNHVLASGDCYPRAPQLPRRGP